MLKHKIVLLIKDIILMGNFGEIHILVEIYMQVTHTNIFISLLDPLTATDVNSQLPNSAQVRFLDKYL